MMKAAEDLKQQQLLKEQERQRILTQRIIPLPNVDEIEDHGKRFSAGLVLDLNLIALSISNIYNRIF